jgi:hypothetical protein
MMQHVECRCLHIYEKVENADREWLLMRGSDFNSNIIFKFASSYGKCTHVLGN